jgi:hypothetical protein
MSKITCFVPSGDTTDLQATLIELDSNPLVNEIYITGKKQPENAELPGKACFAEIDSLQTTGNKKDG